MIVGRNAPDKSPGSIEPHSLLTIAGTMPQIEAYIGKETVPSI